MDFFGRLFDFNHDGKTDCFEQALGFCILDEIERETRQSNQDEEDDDEDDNWPDWEKRINDLLLWACQSVA